MKRSFNATSFPHFLQGNPVLQIKKEMGCDASINNIKFYFNLLK
jgi:hypothetical protein